MNYPSYEILLVSQQDDEPGIVDDFSQAGTQHSRIFHSQTYCRFQVRHHMTWAEFKALRDMYDAGPRDSYTNFIYHDVSPAEIYTVKFLARPQVSENTGGGEFYVDVILRGTMN